MEAESVRLIATLRGLPCHDLAGWQPDKSAFRAKVRLAPRVVVRRLPHPAPPKKAKHPPHNIRAAKAQNTTRKRAYLVRLRVLVSLVLSAECVRVVFCSLGTSAIVGRVLVFFWWHFPPNSEAAGRKRKEKKGGLRRPFSAVYWFALSPFVKSSKQ